MENRLPDILLTCGQVSLEPPYELVMLPLCCSALCIRLLGRYSEALGGPIFAVPLARVTAREVIPTMLAEVDCERVRLHAVAVPLEFTPLLGLGVGAAHE